MSRDRLARIARYFLLSGKNPEENRGGSRVTPEQHETTEAVRHHIMKYKCRQSHYSRRKCSREYLAPELNINKMHTQFCKERDLEGKPKCSLSKYKHIFYSKFNLGFGSPHSDTCSTCKEQMIKIKSSRNNEAILNEARTEHKLHKLRAEKFFTIMKTKDENNIDVMFDMQQNQPLPKVSIGEAFYLRQAWLYNLCVMKDEKPMDKSKVHFYTWLETEGGRGANEVASGVKNYLENLENRLRKEGVKSKVLRLFSDSCTSQNKNSILLATLSRFLETSKVFFRVEHYFPIRGHSFMPPDRVFGNVEKKYRQNEEILSPKQYRDILSEHGEVKVLEEDWHILDLKRKSSEILKQKLPFTISKARVIEYRKLSNYKVQIAIQYTYSGESSEVEVLKKGKNSFREMDTAPRMKKVNHVSKEKSQDVAKLMKFIEMPDDAKTFYEEVLKGNHTKDNLNVSDVMENMDVGETY